MANGDAAIEMEYEDHGMARESSEDSMSLDTVAERENAKSDLAKQENTDVSRWRYAVAIMLTITSGVVLAFTYSFMSSAEEDEFKSSFDQSSSTVIAASRFYAFNVINTFEGMTDTITTRALRNGDKWPFVVVEDFELAGAHARITSFTEAVFFAPLVFGPFREEWEGWASDQTEWIEESRSYADLTRSWLAEEEFWTGDLDGSGPETCRSCSGSSTIEEDYIRDGTLSPRRGSGEIFAIEEADTCLVNPPCELTRDRDRAIYAPVWQMSPPPSDTVAVGFNLFSNEIMSRIVSVLVNSEVRSIITGLVDIQLLIAGVWSDEDHAKFHTGSSEGNEHATDPMTLPHSVVVTSIYSKLVGSANNRIVGFVAAIIPWDVYFSRLLPPGVDGIYAVVESTCDSVSTYLINGPAATFLEYTLSLYASKVYRERFHSTRTTIFMLVLGSVFIVTGAVFVMFLRYVGRRQAVVVESALRTNAIVASLFPSTVRDRVLESNENAMHNPTALGARQRLKNFMNGDVEDDGADNDGELRSKPIADLFPETTIMFCDMVGFTAWSSSRAPTDVFGLLERVYGAFDERARKRKVFKVETVGDQYVAVTGLPHPMKDHAVVCCRFAAECSLILDALVKELEVEFGPDTADLNMRFGLHSGPVTAGVLRGERSRFQLFGDTVNTASRLESTGKAGRIQVSEETAALLTAAGKARWLRPREEKVTAKGKGELSTYWLERHDDSLKSNKSMAHGMVMSPAPSVALEMAPPGTLTDRSARLVDYNVDVLMRLLRNIASRRKALRIQQTDVEVDSERLDGHTVLEEVQETIALPAFNAKASNREVDPSQIDLGERVEYELQHYVATIASLYNDNPFHNFEHVSHVAMSVAKLMSRIVAPEMEGSEGRSKARAHKLHDYTYGITSDPLTQFACVFSALVHDVDHLGVPNTQLVLEQPQLAKLYKNKSVAEQHSVDLSWALLMQPFYQTLQKAIFATPDEYNRFRQLVVNSVMATDIMDPDLKQLRNKRWEKAFSTTNQDSTKQEDINRKATIVIEHLIQASDVSHTMQHWHIYRKWNERLFEEMYKAHLLFRSGTNPADNWAQSEVGFFDFYIIPLAKKLNDCGVFGVSSFEYLDYAQRNRDEWKVKGEQIVAEMVQSVNERLFQRQEI